MVLPPGAVGLKFWSQKFDYPSAVIDSALALTVDDDILSATGDVGAPSISGSLNVAQAGQTLAAAGTVTVDGALGINQAAQTLVAAGGPVGRATLNAGQADQTLAASARAIIGGALGLGQANQTLSAAGSVTVRGTLAIPQAAQTIAANAVVITGINGTLNVPQAAQTLAAAGTVAFGVIHATLDVTQANQILTASGGLTIPTPLKRCFKIATENRSAMVASAVVRSGSSKPDATVASVKGEQRAARVPVASNIAGKVPKDQRTAIVN